MMDEGAGIDTRAILIAEPSVPRIFAAGDVRAGSLKRMAPAVAAGSSAVQSVHMAIGFQGFAC